MATTKKLTPAEKGEKIARADARLEKARMAYRIAVDDYCEGLITNAEARKIERRFERARDAFEAAVEA